MNININELFRSKTFGKDGSDKWNRELFDRAYFTASAPFKRAIDRLDLGFSVLAYVPGNCMTSAASLVKEALDGREWSDFLELPGADSTQGEIWQKASNITSSLRTWFGPKGEGNQPAAVFHNLDFLSDGRGGVHSHLEAQTAVAGLVAGTRSGLVLGLSDRDEPELPSAITRAFNEVIRLDEIPSENFHRIIPVELGENLQTWGVLTTGTVWLMASRLRWLDPIRVYRILEGAVSCGSAEDVFREILNSTRTLEYLQPEDAYTGADPVGYDEATLQRVKQTLILPFTEWATFRGDETQYRRALLKLPPGAIFYGPPGTGKTLLARWIAREIGLPVRTVSGGEIRTAGWGEAEKNVRRLFRDARRAAPCVLILDDADDLLPSRAETEGGTASAERAVVNEFLQQLAGFRGRLEGVLVILTTNQFPRLDDAAKERLAFHCRIPYPQTASQVGQIVDCVAREYDHVLDPSVRDALVDRFFQPRVGVVDGPEADGGRFSPREIQQAMRMLEVWDGKHRLGDTYTPTMADVERVKTYYSGHNG